MKTYDERHGGPYDRGGADSYYSRSYNPHFYVGASYSSTLVKRDHMTKEEVEAYKAGWEHNEKYGGKKEWE